MKKMMIAFCLVALVVGGCSAFNQEVSESKEIYLGDPNEPKFIRSYVEVPYILYDTFVYKDLNGDGEIDEECEFVRETCELTLISPRLLILTKEEKIQDPYCDKKKEE